jgi:hypothetical protein
VKVRLELDRTDFKQGLRDAANDTRKFDGEVKTLGQDAERTGVELKSTATEAGKLGDDVKRSARDVDGLGASTKKVGDEVEKTRTKVRNYRREVEAPAKKGGLLDFAIDEWAGKTSKSLLNALSGGAPGIAGLSSGMSTALVAGAVAAAPAVGAALTGGILLGAGGLGLAGGIALAAQSPIVKASYADLGTYVHDQLTEAANGLDAPVAQSAGIMRGAFNQVLPGIKHDFDLLAPVVEHLATGVASFAVNAMPGFNKAVAASVPLLKQVADDSLPRMGSAVGDFFDTVSRGGPGAQAFFRDLTTGVDLATKQLGAVTLALSKLYEKAHSATAGGALLGGTFNAWTTALEKLDGGAKKAKVSMDPLDEALKKIPQSADQAGLGVTLAAADFNTLSSAISKTQTTTDMLAGQMADKILNSMMSLDQATLGFAESQTRLSQSIDQNKLALDIHSEAGQRNREAILGAVQANISEYDAMIRSGASADVASSAYDANTQALERQLQKAGFTQGAIDGLIGKYRNVPANVDTDIAVNGLTSAINNLSTLISQANNLDGRHVEVWFHGNVTGQFPTGDYGGGGRPRSNAPPPSSPNFGGGAGGRRWGGIVEHAAMGSLRDANLYSSVSSGARYAFAEPSTGGEAFVPKFGDYGRSMGILNRAAGWYGARVVPGGTGGAPSIVINVNGAMDPQAVATAVDMRLRQVGRSSDLLTRGG